ncbi:hypothetical protein KAZ82_02635, partial [Candidatus Babeliales bacterium]|nr:hypothetical protein [Candidatus Babeliales bacterium]
MKKLFLFLSILLSCAFSFAAVQKRMAASANSVIYQYDIRAAVAFNKIKEALERKAWENGTGVLSKEEIKEILDAEKCFLLKEQCMKNFDKPCFPNYVIENSILCGGVGGI